MPFPTFQSRRGLTWAPYELLGGLGSWWPPLGPGGAYLFRATAGGAVPAQPTTAGAGAPRLRTHDVKIPFVLDFAPDLGATDTITSASVTVFAHPSPGAGVATDVTQTLFWPPATVSGSRVTTLLGNANAVLGTHYTIVVVVSLASGETIQESIEGVVCDQ